METSIEVRYAGVVVGRTAHAREVDAGKGLFVGIAEPLPVGTLVTLKIGDAVREAHVDQVVEAADPSSVGMRVVFDTAAGVAFAPPPRAPSAAPIPTAPEPAVVAAPVAWNNATPPDNMTPAGGDAPSAAVAAEAEASEAISAPLSLAEPGGGKKRRKRR